MILDVNIDTIIEVGDNSGIYDINNMIPTDKKGIERSIYIDCFNRIITNYNLNLNDVTNLSVRWRVYDVDYPIRLSCYVIPLYSTSLLLYNSYSGIGNAWGVTWRDYVTTNEEFVCDYRNDDTYSLSKRGNYSVVSYYTSEYPNPKINEWTEGNQIIWTYISGISNNVKTPYEEGGFSESGGGNGNYDDSSDEQSLKQYDVNLVNNSGLTIFKLSPNEFGELSRDLQDPGILQLIGNIFGLNPLESIINLYVTPFSSTTSTEPSPLKIGLWETPYDYFYATEQMIVYNCGTINISEYWGNFLDYSPHTKIYIFLPYIGEYELPVDNVMNCEIGLRYIFDLLTGVASAEIYNHTKKVQVATFTSQISYKLPLTSTEHTELIQGLLTFGAAVATKGLATKVGSTSAVMGLSSVEKRTDEYFIKKTGDLPMFAGEYNEQYVNILSGDINKSATSIENGSNKLASNAAMNLMCNKVSVERFGDISNSAVFFSYPIPFLRITRPQVSIPESYNKLYGYPSNISTVLGELTGYTEIAEIHLENIPNALSEEMTMINNLLVGGVIL